MPCAVNGIERHMVAPCADALAAPMQGQAFFAVVIAQRPAPACIVSVVIEDIIAVRRFRGRAVPLEIQLHGAFVAVGMGVFAEQRCRQVGIGADKVVAARKPVAGGRAPWLFRGVHPHVLKVQRMVPGPLVHLEHAVGHRIVGHGVPGLQQGETLFFNVAARAVVQFAGVRVQKGRIAGQGHGPVRVQIGRKVAGACIGRDDVDVIAAHFRQLAPVKNDVLRDLHRMVQGAGRAVSTQAAGHGGRKGRFGRGVQGQVIFVQAGNDRLVQADDGKLRVRAAVVAFDIDAHAPVGSGILREPVHPPVVLEVVRTAAQGLVIVAAVDILPEAAAFIPALQLPFPGETLRLVVPVLEIKAREHVRPVGKGVFPLAAGHGVGRQPALSLVDKLIAQRPGGPVCRAVLPAGADRAALADVHAVLVLHVNELLAHEAGRIAVFFPAGEDDVAQALGIAAFHAFLPGGKAQVFQRAPCGAGAGAPVRHGQDALSGVLHICFQGIVFFIHIDACGRVDIHGFRFRVKRQTSTGDDREMPLGIRSNAWAGHGKTKRAFGKGPDVGKILSFLGRFLSLNSLRGGFIH